MVGKWVVYPFIYKVLYLQGGAGCLPSTEGCPVWKLGLGSMVGINGLQSTDKWHILGL